MREAGRTGVAPRARRWTSALLVSEVALTLVVLTGAGLMLRSLVALYRADAVIDASRVLTVQLTLPDHYATPEQRSAFYLRLEDWLNERSNLPLAAVVSHRPFVGAFSRRLSLDGGAPMAGTRLPSVAVVAIGPHYFDALNLPLLQGRAFTSDDGRPGREVVIVNRRFADMYFRGEDPIGHRIRLTDSEGETSSGSSLTIVGVSPTVRQNVAGGEQPLAYVPLRSESGGSASLLIGGLADPAAAVDRLRQEVAALDADLTVSNVRPLTDLLADSRLQHRLIGTVLTSFAGVALLLSVVGVYAVTAYAVRQRTQEIGIRMALGAQASQVVWLFVRRGLMPLAIGIGVGLVGALAVGKLLQAGLIGTSPSDPLTLALIVLLLATVAVVACLLPARRAALLDPLVVLRYN